MDPLDGLPNLPRHPGLMNAPNGAMLNLQQPLLIPNVNPMQQHLAPPPSNQTAVGGPIVQDLNLASILTCIQSEWRRFERERNEWEIERATMRARIALLEGERRAAENLKSDYNKRIKMLEYAVRQERSRIEALKSAKEDNGTGEAASTADKPTTSIANSPRTSEAELPANMAQSGTLPSSLTMSTIQPQPITNNANASTSQQTPAAVQGFGWRGAAVARGPQWTAKTKEYLKQCLQEIAYLTSDETMNPVSHGKNARPLKTLQKEDVEEKAPTQILKSSNLNYVPATPQSMQTPLKTEDTKSQDMQEELKRLEDVFEDAEPRRNVGIHRPLMPFTISNEEAEPETDDLEEAVLRRQAGESGNQADRLRDANGVDAADSLSETTVSHLPEASVTHLESNPTPDQSNATPPPVSGPPDEQLPIEPTRAEPSELPVLPLAHPIPGSETDETEKDDENVPII